MAEKYGEVEVKEVTQITIVLEHVPGSLARITEALHRANVNIEGTCNAEGLDETLPLRLVVDKPDEAKKAIEALGDSVSFELCLSVQCQNDRPGFMAAVTRKLADANINIKSIYHTSSGRGGDATIYIVVDKVNRKKAFELMKTL